MSKNMFWVGTKHDGVTILEREYSTLEEAQGDRLFKGYWYGRVIVETDNPEQWERDNNPQDYFQDVIEEEVRYFVYAD